jgi:hypothetical protein
LTNIKGYGGRKLSDLGKILGIKSNPERSAACVFFIEIKVAKMRRDVHIMLGIAREICLRVVNGLAGGKVAVANGAKRRSSYWSRGKVHRNVKDPLLSIALGHIPTNMSSLCLKSWTNKTTKNYARLGAASKYISFRLRLLNFSPIKTR